MRYEVLKSKIAAAGKKYYEARQISKRLEELLPSQLRTITRQYRKKFKAGKAERLALKDPEYVSFLNQVATMNNLSLESRVLWETRSMLLQSWQMSDSMQRCRENRVKPNKIK